MSQFRAKFNKYDITFSEFIRLRDKCCQRCGKGGRLECSHIYGRGNMGIRCDPANAKALCNTCHRWYHSNPMLAAEWVLSIIGQTKYDILRLKANKPTKRTLWEKDQIRKIQLEDIKKLKAGGRFKPFNKIYG